MAQVRAEYDFEAQPNSGEMTIAAGEILTVIRENIDGGWMEGRNVRGSVGLFPETYVTPYQASQILIVFLFLLFSLLCPKLTRGLTYSFVRRNTHQNDWKFKFLSASHNFEPSEPALCEALELKNAHFSTQKS
ncbi:hypothetical protein CRE_03505 [Caenorhabditis remanei]|uniref:SH3 domain-containing protein n=1 Tax=Caenorhabditis remanei TaxID=31234 RepID=E3NKN7_CAERE|nr:hypothetical protein CRE_03505 [Caenorhabditis remanei]